MKILIEGVEQDCNDLVELYEWVEGLEKQSDYVRIKLSELANGDPALELTGLDDPSLDE